MYPPVDSTLTAEELVALIEAPNVEADFGLDLLAADLSFVEDLSESLSGEINDDGDVEISGRISWNGNRPIHTEISDLRITRELAWGVDLVRPYMTLSADGMSARWNRGVFALTTPESVIGETPRTYAASGSDRLMLLRRETRADYTATAGTTYRQALLDAFAAAGLTGVLIDGAAADAVLPKDRTWPLVARDVTDPDPDQASQIVTYLRIVNDLLRAINFRGVYCDQNGLFRCHAYVNPAIRAPEWTLDADASFTTIVGEWRTERVDVWNVPNVWVFRNRLVDVPAPGAGLYEVELDVLQPDHPMSVAQRGLEWVANIDYEAATQATLVDLGDRRVAADLRVTSKLDITTGPFPGAGHADVFTYRDAAAGTSKVQAMSWDMPLDGGDVTWQLERVA